MILPIYIYGQPVLRKVAEPIDKDYPGLDELIQNMKDTMYDSDGIGIAAPQVGVSARVVYIDVDALSDKFPELKDKRLVLINPEITVDETSPTETREEGCLSVPGIHENVTPRFTSTTSTRTGRSMTRTSTPILHASSSTNATTSRAMSLSTTSRLSASR